MTTDNHKGIGDSEQAGDGEQAPPVTTIDPHLGTASDANPKSANIATAPVMAQQVASTATMPLTTPPGSVTMPEDVVLQREMDTVADETYTV
jgi:hypothetical protein